MADTKTANNTNNDGATDAGWTAPTAGAAQPAQAQQARVAVNDAGIRSVASNFFNATASTDGMAVDFGYWVPRRDNNGNFIQYANLDSRVVMSWAVAKRLSMDLGRIIREYEEQVGPINLGGPGQPQG
jgi:hypothetical protein